MGKNKKIDSSGRHKTFSLHKKNRRLAQLRRQGKHILGLPPKPNDALNVSYRKENHNILSHELSPQQSFEATVPTVQEELPQEEISSAVTDKNVYGESSSERLSTTKDAKEENENCSSHHEFIDGSPSGRRIFDVRHLFSQIFDTGKHEPFSCDITDMLCVSETRMGLVSSFHLKCKMCGITKKLTTEDENSFNIPINSAIVLGAVSTGIGHSQVEEIAAVMNMPMMSDKTFIKTHGSLSDVLRESAWTSMEDAANEERHLAIQNGDVDKNGVPCITVVTDGAWSKRSYNVNYDASSGVGCIIGYKTGKLLFLGIKNKYCTVCSRAKSKNIDVPTHTCYRNWTSTSTSMESEIIIEGFKRSIELHNLKYTKMVGDGDSSVFKKLLIQKPYGNDLVEKIECRNHLLRNLSTKLREITNRKRSNSKNEPIPPSLRQELSKNAHRIRICLVKASKFRMQEGYPFAEKVSRLIEDIKNVPSHVFGEHKNCANMNYFTCSRKATEINLVPQMTECGLFDDIMFGLQRLISNASSLILNMDNNLAEHYNSVVCKFVGGKRVNFSLRGSYELRCHAAALSFNSLGDYHSVVHKSITNLTPTSFIKKFVSKRKRKIDLRRRYSKKRKYDSKKVALPDFDYGPQASVSTLNTDSFEYLEKEAEFLSSITKNEGQIAKLENDTREQRNNPLWVKERYTRITASNFGIICKLKKQTSCANTIKKLLYSKFCGNESTKWGLENENNAIRSLENLYNFSIRKCGLFIDLENNFLGASPDGIVDNEVLVEVKCPRLLKEISVEEGITTGKIKFAKLIDGQLYLNRNHNYYYQIQGQLAVTRRKLCYFCVWSPVGMMVEKILRDEQFWAEKMLPKLKTFFFRCMVPELVDPCFSKGLPIRNPSRE